MSVRAAAAVLGASLCACAPAPAGPPLVLYTSLSADVAAGLAAAYTEQTGTAVHYLVEPAAVLVDKLEARAHRPPADVLLAEGAESLARAVDSGVLRPLPPGSLPAGGRGDFGDPDGYWTGLLVRPGVVAAAGPGQDPGSVDGYADLAETRFRGRLCLPGSSTPAGAALVAALIAGLGERDAELAVRGWIKNLARPVFDSDDALLDALVDGRCSAAIVDAGRALRRVRDGAELVIAWPDDAGVGTAVSVTGAGVSRHAARPGAAAEFVAWLSTPGIQRWLAGQLDAWPTHPAAEPPPALVNEAGFRPGPLPVSATGYYRDEADRLAERARYP